MQSKYNKYKRGLRAKTLPLDDYFELTEEDKIELREYFEKLKIQENKNANQSTSNLAT